MTFEKNLKKEMKKKERKPKKIKFKTYEFYWYLTPIAVPLVGIDMVSNYISNKQYNSLVWSDEKAKKIVDKAFPKFADYDKETGKIFFCNQWDTIIWFHNCRFIEKEWVRKFRHKLHEYMVERYEIEGFEKEVKPDQWAPNEKWVCFTKK